MRTHRAIGHARWWLRKIDSAIPICRQAAVVYARTRSGKQPFPTLSPKRRRAPAEAKNLTRVRRPQRGHFQLLLADLRAGALRLGDGGGSEAGSGSTRRVLPALATAATGVLSVDFD